MLITFSGVDGSGKTTQIERIEKRLRTRGSRVDVFWFRPGYSKQLDWLRAQVRRIRPQALPTTQQGEARQRVFRRPGIRLTWMAMAVADTILQLGMTVRKQLMAGHVVLCDRYVDDAVLDLDLRFAEFRRVAGPVRAMLRAVCPTPDLAFLLLVPKEVMEHRLAVKNEPFPDDPAVRSERFDRYQKMAASRRYVVIDAAQDIETVEREMLGHIESVLNEKRR